MPVETLLWFGFCALCTYGAAHAYRWLAVRNDLLAHPNERSAHTRPTPTGGGVAFVTVFTLGMLWMWYLSLVSDRIVIACIGPILVGAVGFADDIRPLPVWLRASVYVAVAGWCIYWIGFPVLDILGVSVQTGLLGSLFGVLSLVWLQNLYNFMDGIDGLATMEAVFVCGAVLVIGGDWQVAGWNGIALLAMAVCAGFAVINWPRAKLFMGDVGSSFLGLSLGILSLAHATVSVWTWMILLGYFISDACLTITVRLVRGERVYRSHSQHAYQHLTRRFGAAAVLLGILAMDVVWLWPIAVLSHNFPDWAALLLILACAPLLICQFLWGAGQQQPRLDVIRS